MLALVVAFYFVGSSNKINRLIALFIIATFMSSNYLFFLLLIFSIFITLKETHLINIKTILIIFLLLSQFNAFIESNENEKNTYIINECINNFKFEICNSNGYK